MIPVWLIVLAALEEIHIVNACGTLSTNTTEIIEGQTLQLTLITTNIHHNKPENLLLHKKTHPNLPVTLFNRELELKTQRAIEVTDGSNFIYKIPAITTSQAGQYILRCKAGDFSNYVEVNVIPDPRKLNAACGTLSTNTAEIIEGQTLQLTFITADFHHNKPKQLLLHNKPHPNLPVTLFSRELEGKKQRATESTVDSKYVYKISAITTSQAGQYMIICEADDYSNYVEVNVISAARKLNEERCGNLTIFGQNNKTVGFTIQLVFDFKDRDIANVDWEHLVDGTFERINDDRNKYEQTEDTNIYVLKIYQSKTMDAGTYRVNCGGQLYSNTVHVLVAVLPPDKPRLFPLVSFPGCTDCIKAVPAQWSQVTCESQNGSPPIIVTLFKDGVEVRQTNKSTLKYQNHRMKVTYQFIATETSNWATITCNVTNEALSTPYTTSATIYVFRKPEDPILDMPVIKEGMETLIGCSSQNGRPQPNIKYILNNTFKTYPMSVIFNNDKTYSVKSSFKRRFFRQDNKTPITCCVEHDLINGKLQCQNKNLTVNFQPVDVILKEVSRAETSNGFTKLSLLCTSGVSNPVSNITWTGFEGIETTILASDMAGKEFGGYQTSQLVAIMVSREDNGKEIKCEISNTVFPTVNIEAHAFVNITYPPYVTISQGPELIVGNGQSVSLICSVDSNPPSNISWWTEGGVALNQGSVNLREQYLYFQSVEDADAGVYFCRAKNGRGLTVQNISLIVNDSLIPAKDTLLKDAPGIAGIIAGVIGTLLVVALIVIVVILILRMQRKRKMGQVNNVNQQNEEQNHLNNQGEDPVYNDVDEVNEDPGQAEYATVIPKSQRLKAQNRTMGTEVSTKEPINAPTKELVYAELDLETSDVPTVFHKPETEQIEYVELDFKAKAARISEQIDD